MKAYAYLTFDSVLAFAYGLQAFLADNHTLSTNPLSCTLECGNPGRGKWRQGETLLRYIKQVSRGGVAQDVGPSVPLEQG